MDKYGTIVLGCTHFPYYKDMFRKLLPQHVTIIDGSIGTVKNLKRILTEMNSLNEGSGNIVFYNSGLKVEDKAKLGKYMGLFEKLDSINEWD
jgi:glutamate racemase